MAEESDVFVFSFLTEVQLVTACRSLVHSIVSQSYAHTLGPLFLFFLVVGADVLFPRKAFSVDALNQQGLEASVTVLCAFLNVFEAFMTTFFKF